MKLNEIRYGAPVVRIEQDEHSGTAVVKAHGRLERLQADRIICTLPFTVLRQIAFSPPLSSAKQRAIQKLPYGSVPRVYLQYLRGSGWTRGATDLRMCWTCRWKSGIQRTINPANVASNWATCMNASPGK